MRIDQTNKEQYRDREVHVWLDGIELDTQYCLAADEEQGYVLVSIVPKNVVLEDDPGADTIFGGARAEGRVKIKLEIRPS